MTNVQDLAERMAACRIVDLSNDVSLHADGPFATSMDVLEPEPGAGFFCENVLPKLAPDAVGQFGPSDFPDEAFLRHEMVRASVHAGSHVDAPGHYGPAHDGVFREINDAPLRSFLAPGVMCDVGGAPGRVVRRADVDVESLAEKALSASGNAIVLLRTGGSKGLGGDLIEAFIDAGIDVIGTDSESFDGPFPPMIEEYLETGDQQVLWPAHVLGRRRPYYQLEKLRNLETLPESGFFVIALPMRIEGATAAWTRAIALVP